MTDHALPESGSPLRDTLLRKLERPVPGWARPLFLLFAVVGGLTFLLLATGEGADRAWHAYHVNWLFWTGLSQAGVMFGAVTLTARGRWSFPIRRIAEASVSFLPVAFVLFLLLWVGRGHVFPWVREPVTEPAVKAFWLRDWFLFARDGAALIVMFGLSVWFVYHSLRPDAALLQAGAPERRKKLYAWLAKDWTTPGRGAELTEQRLLRLGAGLIPLYAVVMSILAFDLVMSLAPYWLSSLLGGYFFMASWLAGLMTLALLVIFWRRHLELEDLISPKVLHDLGKLCFGFTVFWTYLFFSQFLVIWYGNMPEETSFLFLRMASPTWRTISTLMVTLVFLVPFWGLIGVKPKKTPRVLATFAIISLCGLWLDRYILVVPSLDQAPAHLPLGWQELLVTVGYAGLWGLAYLWFAERFPIVSPALLEQRERRQHPHHSE